MCILQVQLGTDHYFPGGGGGGRVWKISLCKLFFNLCTYANIFFSKCKLIFSKHIVFANNLFCLFRPCKQFFFSIFHTPSRIIMVRPEIVLKIVLKMLHRIDITYGRIFECKGHCHSPKHTRHHPMILCSPNQSYRERLGNCSGQMMTSCTCQGFVWGLVP